MPDTVTLTLDAQQYHRELARVTAQNQRLASSGASIGEGFIRGERVVRTATQNIASSLLMSGDAATTALVAMQGLERVFKIGILPTVAVAGGIALFEKFHEQIQKTKDLYKDFQEELKKPVGGETGPSEFVKEIDTISEKMKKLREDNDSFLNKLMRFLNRGTSGGLGRDTAFGGPAFRPSPAADPNAKLNQAQKDADKRTADLTDKEGKRLADAIARLADKINNTIEQTLKGPRDLLEDIGSGQFMRDFAKNQERDANVSRGQAIASEIEDAIQKGIPLDPVLQKEAQALGLVGGSKGFSIRDLATLDFSNMNDLSKYDFSGLIPLNGFTVFVK